MFGSRDTKDEGMSSQRPLIIHLWKMQGRGAEPLIEGDCSDQLESDGGPLKVRLFSEWPPVKPGNEDPDFVFRLVAERKSDDSDEPSKWDVTIQAISGGLVEASDRFMYYAPEGGYRKEFRWTNSDPSDRFVFLTIRGGQVYGKASIAVSEDKGIVDGEALSSYVISMHFTVNPTGSRSLEPDPERLSRVTRSISRRSPRSEIRAIRETVMTRESATIAIMATMVVLVCAMAAASAIGAPPVKSMSVASCWSAIRVTTSIITEYNTGGESRSCAVHTRATAIRLPIAEPSGVRFGNRLPPRRRTAVLSARGKRPSAAKGRVGNVHWTRSLAPKRKTSFGRGCGVRSRQSPRSS